MAPLPPTPSYSSSSTPAQRPHGCVLWCACSDASLGLRPWYPLHTPSLTLPRHLHGTHADVSCGVRDMVHLGPKTVASSQHTPSDPPLLTLAQHPHGRVPWCARSGGNLGLRPWYPSNTPPLAPPRHLHSTHTAMPRGVHCLVRVRVWATWAYSNVMDLHRFNQKLQS